MLILFVLIFLTGNRSQILKFYERHFSLCFSNLHRLSILNRSKNAHNRSEFSYFFRATKQNASERGIRKLKIKLKNSGTFRSDLGADAFFDLHSIIETAKKHKQTPFEAIRALFSATYSPVLSIDE